MSKSSKLLTQVGSVAALCFIFVAFQNCGQKMEFAPADGVELKDATIIEIPNEDDVIDNNDDVVDNSGGDIGEVTPPSDDGSVDEEDTPPQPPIDIVDDDARGGNSNGNGGNNDNDNNDDNVQEDSGPQHYICIVEGPGKSQKLALVNNQLVAQTSAVKTVCTTQKGCLEIASQKFNVTSAEERGFCKKDDDSHSIHLSESQLQEVINNIN